MLLSDRTESITVTRAGAGAYVDGAWQRNATPQTLILKAIVQPYKGPELLQFPEGQRARQWLRIYCDQELRTADESTGADPDVVTYGAHQYQLQRVEDRSQGPLAHYRALAVKVEPTAESS
jgi:hypothetical protein